MPPPSRTTTGVRADERRPPSGPNGSVWFEVRHLDEVGEARSRLRTLLQDSRHPQADDAILVLSELVTNAVQHGAGGCTVEIRLEQGCLHVGVDDPASAPPILMSPAPGDLGGRGLRIVDAIATSWGWEARPTGKRVWADIDVGVPDETDVPRCGSSGRSDSVDTRRRWCTVCPVLDELPSSSSHGKRLQLRPAHTATASQPRRRPREHTADVRP